MALSVSRATHRLLSYTRNYPRLRRSHGITLIFIWRIRARFAPPSESSIRAQRRRSKSEFIIIIVIMLIESRLHVNSRSRDFVRFAYYVPASLTSESLFINGRRERVCVCRRANNHNYVGSNCMCCFTMRDTAISRSPISLAPPLKAIRVKNAKGVFLTKTTENMHHYVRIYIRSRGMLLRHKIDKKKCIRYIYIYIYI